MDSGTPLSVTIQPSHISGLGTILLADKEGFEQKYMSDTFPNSDYTTVYLENLLQFGYHPQLADYKFFVFKDDEVSVLMEACCDNLQTLDYLMFESLDGGYSYSLTTKGKHVFRELLLAYQYLEENRIFFSSGDNANNILFFKGDMEHTYPRIINFYDDGFNEATSSRKKKKNVLVTNNCMKWYGLLNRLLGTRTGDRTLSSFVSNIRGDYDFAVNHPALWRSNSSYNFAIEAGSYIKQNPEAVRSLFNGDVQWKTSLKNDLQDYYNIVVKKRARRQNEGQSDPNKMITGEYNNDLGGQLLFKRDTFVHYNQNKRRASNEKSTIEIEEWFHQSMPDLNWKLYTHMVRCGFLFEDKPKKF